jgi:hypothetical protein
MFLKLSSQIVVSTCARCLYLVVVDLPPAFTMERADVRDGYTNPFWH